MARPIQYNAPLPPFVVLAAAMLEKAGSSVIRSGPPGRFQTLGYLGTRFTALFGTLGRPLEWAFNATRLRQMTVPINLEDLFTVYARKV